MLEILIVWCLAKKVGEIAKSKGHGAGLYMFLTAVFWIGGEIAGCILGVVVLAAIAAGGEEPNVLLIYVFALIGAAAGAALSFLIANNLTPVESRYHRRSRSWEEEADDRRPQDGVTAALPREERVVRVDDRYSR